METQSESLENKLEPDWRQWFPFYGMFRIKKALENNEPIILENLGLERYQGSVIYHIGVTMMPTFAAAIYFFK